MNKYNLEITYKDICSVTRTKTPSGEELVVELFDGTIIKAYYYEKRPFSMFGSQANSCNEKYEELSKVVNDWLIYTQVINNCYDNFDKELNEVEAKLEAE